MQRKEKNPTYGSQLREAIKKKQSKYGHYPEGGGVGLHPRQNVFGALFLGALYFGKIPIGGRVKLLPKDLEEVMVECL